MPELIRVLRVILFPFTFLYGLIIILRNAMYDAGVFKSVKFDIPIISIGNLTVGGAGKSPMTEYIVRLLQSRNNIAILSRGYGRKTRGFLKVQVDSAASEVGDEPLQFKNKFPDLIVAVCEDRVNGIRKLQDSCDLILLDDAYQHRAVKPGFSILLFDHSNLMKWQWLLPTGDLREPLSGIKRADCIVVTKTPEKLSAAERQQILKRLKPAKDQPVFFSFIQYGDLISLSGAVRSLRSLSATTHVFLLTGIANPLPLVNELQKYTGHIQHHGYPDHHIFTRKNMSKLAADFNSNNSGDKIIITTEKDWQRLKSPDLQELLFGLPVYFLPVQAAIHGADHVVFEALIFDYVTER